jgi:hypothetical protein
MAMHPTTTDVKTSRSFSVVWGAIPLRFFFGEKSQSLCFCLGISLPVIMFIFPMPANVLYLKEDRFKSDTSFITSGRKK